MEIFHLLTCRGYNVWTSLYVNFNYSLTWVEDMWFTKQISITTDGQYFMYLGRRRNFNIELKTGFDDIIRMEKANQW